jgi:hypothetical protein
MKFLNGFHRRGDGCGPAGRLALSSCNPMKMNRMESKRYQERRAGARRRALGWRVVGVDAGGEYPLERAFQRLTS